MIITYPISQPFVLGNEKRVVPNALYNSSEILSGSYPVGKNRFWHGGVHIHPNDRNAPIIAVADGEVVAYRYDDSDAKDEFFDKTPYSRSFVLLKHETELGQTSLGINKVVFYSLYMHLRSWSEVKNKVDGSALNFLRRTVPAHQLTKDGKSVFDKHKRPVMERSHDEVVQPEATGVVIGGADFCRVRRGDILGYCGSIPDNITNPSCGIHFEIFLSDTKFLENPFKTLWGKCILKKPLNAVESVLKTQEISVDLAKPLFVGNGSNNGYFKIAVNHNHYWLSEDQVRTEDSGSHDEKKTGKAPKKPHYLPMAKDLKVYTKDPAKNTHRLEKGEIIVPWDSPWLDAGEFREQTIDGTTWIQVYVVSNDKLYWVDKAALQYSSDADWPDFHKVEEHQQYSADGFIDDVGISKLIDSYEKDRADNNRDRLADDEEKIRHLITKHPTEWSRADIAQRFARVTKDDFGPQKLNAEQFAKLVQHINRLAFWEDVPGLPSPQGTWHAHPIKFIEHLSKCIWLSEPELSRLMPNSDKETIDKHRKSLNKTMIQWGFLDRLEQAHYLAQGSHESGGMTKMTEMPSSFASSASIYKGRGFVQITSHDNYAALGSYLNQTVRDVDLVSHPEMLASDSYLAFAASCWYWRVTDVKRSAVKGYDDAVVDEVGRVINCGPGRRNQPQYAPNNREDRLNKFHHIMSVLLT